MSSAASRPDDPLRCPSCDRALPAKAAYRPFCSERCKMVDLGRWLNEEYKVAGESAIAFDEDLGEDLAGPFGPDAGRED